jgi:hypothetical protein
MGVHSGRFGVVDGISTVRNWSINDVSAPQKFVASNTLNGAGRRKGIRSWSGSFGVYGHTPPVMPGEFFAFAGYTSPDDDVSGDGTVYTGDAVVDSIALTVNWQNGEIISNVVNFSGHLVLTNSTDEYLDVTAPTVPEVCGAKIQHDAATPGTFADWENIAQATLNISAANGSYVNSSTNCWTGRKAGPVDATLSVVEQETSRSDLDIYDDVQIKLYVTASLFWHFKWMHLKEFSNISVDRESGAILSRTANFEKNGFVGGATGFIKKPDTTTWWPTP